MNLNKSVNLIMCECQTRLEADYAPKTPGTTQEAAKLLDYPIEPVREMSMRLFLQFQDTSLFLNLIVLLSASTKLRCSGKKNPRVPNKRVSRRSMDALSPRMVDNIRPIPSLWGTAGTYQYPVGGTHQPGTAIRRIRRGSR